LAGLGRKVFNSGDILLASEVQGYLQDQAVMVFDDAAARGSAIPSPTEGMLTYNKDTDALELYDGSAFGPVGSDAGLIHIETRTVTSSSSELFNNVFSATYDNYLVVLEVTNSASVVNRIRLRKNGTDATTNYGRLTLLGNSVNAQSVQSTDPDITFGGAVKQIATINFFRPFVNQASAWLSSTYSLVGNVGFIGVNHSTVDTYDGFNLFPVSGNMTGLVTIFGYRK
jgi:hypothetical protein